MLSYLIRQSLLDALAAGPPYQIPVRSLAVDQMECLKEMEQRGLITSDPVPVLTETGLAEARWFANQKPNDPKAFSPT